MMPDSSMRSGASRGRGGFSLVEVAVAIAIFASVILAMLALLASGAETRGQVRRNTLGVQICSQIHQSLKGFRVGIDDLLAPAAGGAPGLLDPYLPFNFSAFPAAGKPPMVFGFDTDGNPAGKALYADYDSGTNQDGVAFLARIEGKPVAGNPSLTDVLISIETPPGAPSDRRKRQEFRVLMMPQSAPQAQKGVQP